MKDGLGQAAIGPGSMFTSHLSYRAGSLPSARTESPWPLPSPFLRLSPSAVEQPSCSNGDKWRVETAARRGHKGLRPDTASDLHSQRVNRNPKCNYHVPYLCQSRCSHSKGEAHLHTQSTRWTTASSEFLLADNVVDGLVKLWRGSTELWVVPGDVC